MQLEPRFPAATGRGCGAVLEGWSRVCVRRPVCKRGTYLCGILNSTLSSIVFFLPTSQTDRTKQRNPIRDTRRAEDKPRRRGAEGRLRLCVPTSEPVRRRTGACEWPPVGPAANGARRPSLMLDGCVLTFFSASLCDPAPAAGRSARQGDRDVIRRRVEKM